MSKLQAWIAPLLDLSQNIISQAGVVLASAATVFWLFLLPASYSNPYAGVITIVLLPGLLFLGLLLIPVGIWWQRRRGGEIVTRSWKRLSVFLVAATAANLLIASLTTTRAVTYMEGENFCGQACHQVMGPHDVAYKRSVHQRVECAKCHIGEGGQAFVEAKLNGTFQMLDTITNRYPRPVPEGVKRARSSVTTCEMCHKRGLQHEDKLRVITHYGDDEKSTPKKTVLVLHIDKIHGKHPQEECITCHNRVGHPFQLPEKEVDAEMDAGRIPAKLAFAKKNAVAALKAAATGDEAASLFKKSYPSGADEAAAAVKAIYDRNVFPYMKVTWGAYPDNIGHQDAPGCFLCHDGKGLTQDCNTCHTLAAMEEESPKVLAELDGK